MQSVSSAFHEAAQGSIIPLDSGLRISFSKEFDDDVTFFTLGTSLLNGVDVLAPSDNNPLQQWDKYKYQEYGDRLVSMDWTRSIDFPYSVQSAIADVTLDNYDDYFTPNSASPIASTVLPARPIRIFAGYKNASTVQQFVGLTQEMPTVDDNDKTVTFSAMDFLSDIFTLDVTDTIAMQDVTTDVVLAEIFSQFGLSPEQYSLAKGRNKIPFLYFEEGQNAGSIMNQLMQAEMGQLWLDEQGIIRFDQRLKRIQDAVMVFDTSNIIDIGVLDKDNIINTVKITSTIRQVQDLQPIYSTAYAVTDTYQISDSSFIVPAGGEAFYPNATLNDPALSTVTPTIGRKTDTSWFTAIQLGGTEVSSNVSITLSSLQQSSYVMKFTNTNGYDVIIDQVEVWGRPAKVVDTIKYSAYDEASVLAYGTKLLDITNDFFGSLSNCESFAEFVLDAYSHYGGVIEMEVKGDLSLQLGDIIAVDKGSYTGTYRITKIANGMARNSATQILHAERYTQREWFVLDESVLNGTGVLAP